MVGRTGIQSLRVKNFSGIGNKLDPLRIYDAPRQISALVSARNLDIDDRMKIKPAPGFQQVDVNPTEDIYYSERMKRCYIIRNGDLYHYNKNGSASLIQAGVGSRGEWAEVNDQIYFTNGTSFLVIKGMEVRKWGMEVPDTPKVAVTSGNMVAGQYQFTCTFRAPDGRESGAPLSAVVEVPEGSGVDLQLPTHSDYVTVLYATPTNGSELYEVLTTTDSSVSLQDIPSGTNSLLSQFMQPPPGGNRLCLHEGRLCLGQYFSELGYSVVWRSEPLGYEWFDIYGDASLLIPGEVQILGSAGSHLVIGTKDRVYSYNETDVNNPRGLIQYMETGTVAGSLVKDVNGQVWFWTDKGAARAMPFELITDKIYSPPKASEGSAVIMEHGGFGKYSVFLFDPASEPQNDYR